MCGQRMCYQNHYVGFSSKTNTTATATFAAAYEDGATGVCKFVLKGATCLPGEGSGAGHWDSFMFPAGTTKETTTTPTTTTPEYVTTRRGASEGTTSSSTTANGAGVQEHLRQDRRLHRVRVRGRARWGYNAGYQAGAVPAAVLRQQGRVLWRFQQP